MLEELSRRAAELFVEKQASALRDRIRLERSPDGFSAYLDNDLITTILGEHRPEGFAVSNTASLPPRLRGMGLGKAIYGRIMQQAPNQQIFSDAVISPEAQRVYQSMARRRPGTVTTSPFAEFKPGQQAIVPGAHSMKDQPMNWWQSWHPIRQAFSSFIGKAPQRPDVQKMMSVYSAKLPAAAAAPKLPQLPKLG